MSGERGVAALVRPLLLIAVGVVCVGVALIAGIVEAIVPGLGLRFGNAVMAILRQVPDSWTDLFGVMFTGYAAARTGEKVAKTIAAAKIAAPPAEPDREPGA